MKKSSYHKAMLAMRALGEADFKAGKPITAFPTREQRLKISKLAATLSDRARASYEAGWSDAKAGGAR